MKKLILSLVIALFAVLFSGVNAQTTSVVKGKEVEDIANPHEYFFFHKMVYIDYEKFSPKLSLYLDTMITIADDDWDKIRVDVDGDAMILHRVTDYSSLVNSIGDTIYYAVYVKDGFPKDKSKGYVAFCVEEDDKYFSLLVYNGENKLLQTFKFLN